MEGELILCYSRARAIEDGELIDVTKDSRVAGLKYPTALTAAVWASYVRVPPHVVGQGEAGRLWDILRMLRSAARGGFRDDSLRFSLLVRNDNRGPREVTLKAIIGPGDDLEPVITVMLPEED